MVKFFKWQISLNQLQWIGWMIITLLMFCSYLQEEDILWSSIFTVANMLSTVLIIYGNAYWLFPRFYKPGKKLFYWQLVALLLIVITIAKVEFRTFMQSVFFPKDIDDSSRLQLYIGTGVSNIIRIFFSFIFRFAIDYFTVRREQELLKQHTTEMELNLLKAQVQPHFLFNTLNNIYYVAQKESPETAALLEKLSNIMRYFVDEAPKKEVLLATEINFISDYIDLEKMRIRHPLKLDFQVKGDVSLVKVSPMLIMPFVENVFKHGIDKRRTDNLLVLHIQRCADSIAVEVCNRIVSAKLEKQAGSGLQNLRNRLQLLYGNSFDLTITEKDDYFSVHLNIPL
ncbi:sensor histidine kinase [Pedobacter paludis]|nr:histidine kinase [Pedobacter paludis]